MSSPNYAGIDIVKCNFVIDIHGKDKTKTETNNPKGFEHPAACLQKHRGGLIVATRTGSVPHKRIAMSAGVIPPKQQNGDTD